MNEKLARKILSYPDDYSPSAIKEATRFLRKRSAEMSAKKKNREKPLFSMTHATAILIVNNPNDYRKERVQAATRFLKANPISPKTRKPPIPRWRA